MPLDLTVVMATLPERDALRLEAVSSVTAQTRPVELELEFDPIHAGPVPTYNRAAARVETGWLFPFADDDLMDPDHFEILEPALDGRAEIVYSWCRVTGRPGIPEDRYQQPIGDIQRLRRANFIPGSAAIRTDVWRELGGYRVPSPLIAHEDWDFWLRALNLGARFHCVERVTWTYRVDPTWRHVSEGI